ncbi:3,4-dihydroxy-2-butanone-4-phosphate synthase [Emcibacteraceae bacterium]|nr:3,4-dihydroxy-2-butanone-4-phosphate synthase [Emcibacteraceae bacterium]MDA9553578.1 3,4-dihydroxy-2-butanone-4-phosphate synthase [Emcibacteraceae bacterium]MDA9770682.1 3,4-dihydroxy-2-butanone-4-phosphate synthase [Emcibacteraceae bacterium]
MPHNFLSPIEDVLEDAKNGRMFILVDDEDRENEGDLIIPSQMATPDAINFMATHGRGLICLTMTAERSEELGLEMMSQNNRTRHHTAFTTSIEAAEGVTTGISAADRAHTVAVAIDPTKSKDDIVTPGHVFPIIARRGGVLVRAGHTEAAVDIARLAGLIPSGVICEIMNDDGTMARLPDLVEFAKKHNLKLATIADLIAYRRRNDNLVECIDETNVDSEFGGEFKMRAYMAKDDGIQHFTLVKGDPTKAKKVLVRMHSFNIFEDLLGQKGPRTGQFKRAMVELGKEECGVMVFLRENRKTYITDEIAKKDQKAQKKSPNIKNYGIGAQILLDLGVKDFVLLSDSEQNVVGIEGYGLNIIGHQRFDKNIELKVVDKKD